MNEILLQKMTSLSPALLFIGLVLNTSDKYAEFFMNQENLLVFSWFTKSLSMLSFVLVAYINYPRLKKRLKGDENE
jgi:hypothetical protein